MQSFDSFFVVSLSKIAEQTVELLVVQDIQAKPLFAEDALDTIAWSLLSCTGLDTNGCPLGNSKFILLSDNLNICLWLSACQVEKISN